MAIIATIERIASANAHEEYPQTKMLKSADFAQKNICQGSFPDIFGDFFTG